MLESLIIKIQNLQARLIRKSVDDVVGIFIKASDQLAEVQDFINKDIDRLDVEIGNLVIVKRLAESERERAVNIRRKLNEFLK